MHRGWANVLQDPDVVIIINKHIYAILSFLLADMSFSPDQISFLQNNMLSLMS